MKFSATLLAFSSSAALAFAIPVLSESAALESRSGSPVTQAQVEARFAPYGITSYSSGGCTDKTVGSCTSYDGLLSGTVDGVITLATSSGASIVITGGTETGHQPGTYSHSTGYKVDIRHTGTLDSYITNSFPQIGDRGDGYPQWQASSGNIYCDEGSHWDITYY